MNGCIGKTTIVHEQIADGAQAHIILRFALKKGLKDVKAGTVCELDADGVASPCSGAAVDAVLLEDVADSSTVTSANFLVMGCARRSKCRTADGAELTDEVISAARANNIYITKD